MWKVGGEIYTICSRWGTQMGRDPQTKISFSCSDLAYSNLCEQIGTIPVPYLVRAKWFQIETYAAMHKKDIKV